MNTVGLTMPVQFGLLGEAKVPSDKSITHRALLLGALAYGSTRVRTRGLGRDNFATIRVLRQLGVEVSVVLSAGLLRLAREEGITDVSMAEGEDRAEILIQGKGSENFKQPEGVLFCGNSGTTARLLSGILAGCPLSAVLDGDNSLRGRPFRRVTEPLTAMGAVFSGDRLPFTVKGARLRGISFISPRASAQVKSAVLLAGLQSLESVSVCEPSPSRDHTELMLAAMGCAVIRERTEAGGWLVSLPNDPNERRLHGIEMEVPGDFSAAAFFLVGACVIPESKLIIRAVGVNPTRTGLLDILKRMGARVRLVNERSFGSEPVADIEIESSHLRAVEVNAEDVVRAIDEIPILAVAAATAEGETVIRGASELRVKESDRLHWIASVLLSFGYHVDEYEDGLKIYGNPGRAGEMLGQGLVPTDTTWRRTGDHRIAMSGAILEKLCTGRFAVEDTDAVETSFPSFVQLFSSVARGRAGGSPFPAR